MAGVNDNLIPPKKGEIRNPNGRPPGIPNRMSILKYILFDADIDEMGIIKNRPDWWKKVKPKNLYEVMTIAMGAKASSGDHNAYNALNKAMGEHLDITSGGERLPTVIIEGAYAREPKFRPDNQTPQADELAEGSSQQPS